MTRMPENLENLPISADVPNLDDRGRVLAWPRRLAEARVSSLLEAASTYLDERGGGEGLFPTPIEGVNILRSFEARMPMSQVYNPSLCVVIQGAKELLFGDDAFFYGSMECLLVSMDLPASGRIIEASPDDPYIGITIDLDMSVLRDVLDELDSPPGPAKGPGPCFFVGKVDGPLADCIRRLLQMARAPEQIKILFPSMMREICYRLLTGPNGGELCNLTLADSNSARVARAVRILRANFKSSLRVDELADAAGMSQSSFHQHFKALTSMSPIQYQKHLRLLEARRLMVMEDVNVMDAAYQVGYESASQFSREYTRMFSVAPKQDVTNLRRQYSQYAGRRVQSA